MPLDTAAVKELIKRPLSAAERAQADALGYALAAALEEYSLRVKSVGFLRVDTVSLAANDRSKELSGENYNLASIFALKIATGVTQDVLTYVHPKIFLERYDNPAESASVPTKYTVLLSNDGWPQVKFNCPVADSDTLTVYYFMTIGENDLHMARSVNAIVSGAQAYFYGIKSETGEKYYDAFLDHVKLARATDTYTPTEPDQQYLSGEYREVKSVADSIRGSRT